MSGKSQKSNVFDGESEPTSKGSRGFKFSRGGEYGAPLNELADVAAFSGKTPSSLLLKRASNNLVVAEEPVWFWLDSEELAHSSEAVVLVSVVNTVVMERSHRGFDTNVRTVTRSIVDGMSHVVERATQTAKARVGVGPNESVPEALVDEYEEVRVKLVTEAVQDNLATEKQLFKWAERFGDGTYLGSVEFRGTPHQAGSDYVMVGVGTNKKVLSEWVIMRSERCQGTAPFEGVGVTVDPWSLAGAEVERKMSERWHEAVKNPPAVHSESFVRRSIAIWDTHCAEQGYEATVHSTVSPGIVAYINESA